VGVFDTTGGGALNHVDNEGAGEGSTTGSTMFVVGCRTVQKDGSGANNIRRKHDDDAAIATILARAASANSATRYDDNAKQAGATKATTTKNTNNAGKAGATTESEQRGTTGNRGESVESSEGTESNGRQRRGRGIERQQRWEPW
jgi:hypothetical protein